MPFQSDPKQAAMPGKYNPFDGPIPGESLTKAPGSAKYEAPPKFTNLKKASEYIFDQMTKPQHAKAMLAMLHNGTPVEALAKVVLFTGFSEGKWTPDLAAMLAKPVTAMIQAIGERAKVPNMKLGMPQRYEPNPAMKQIAQQKAAENPNAIQMTKGFNDVPSFMDKSKPADKQKALLESLSKPAGPTQMTSGFNNMGQ